MPKAEKWGQLGDLPGLAASVCVLPVLWSYCPAAHQLALGGPEGDTDGLPGVRLWGSWVSLKVLLVVAS